MRNDYRELLFLHAFNAIYMNVYLYAYICFVILYKSKKESVQKKGDIGAMSQRQSQIISLHQLSKGRNEKKIKIRVVRLWNTFNPRNDELMSMDFIGLDEKVYSSFRKYFFCFLFFIILMPFFNFTEIQCTS